jgi:hypothetical protein
VATETLSFDIFANDRASQTFRRLGLAADGASGDVKELGDRLDKLGTRVSTARVKLDGDKAANAELDKLDVKLIRLGNKAANPNITVEGKIKALADIAAVDLAMDRLDEKTARPSIAPGIGAGLLGGLGGPGGAAGILGLGAAIGPALVGLSQIASALAAAGAGLAAFGALAAPQFLAVKNVLSQVNLDTAAYERATTKAARSTALKHIKQDWADISPAQRDAAHGILGLQAEFGKLSAKLAPLTFKVFNEGLKIAGKLLPDLLPFARAAGDAIDGLLKSLDKSVSGAGFKAFLAQLAALSGPAITALGQGLGKIAVAVGKLILVSASPNSIKVLSGLLTALAGTIDVITFVVGRASGKIIEWKNDFGDIGRVVAGVFRSIGGFYAKDRELQRAWAHDVAAGFDIVRHAVASFGHDIATVFDTVRHAFATAGHVIADTFDTIRHAQGQFGAFQKDIVAITRGISAAFEAMRRAVLVTAANLRHGAAVIFSALRHDIAVIFSALRHDIATAWDAIWANTTGQARAGTGNLVSWFRELPDRVLAALRGLGHSLYAFGHAALTDFLSGLRAVAGSVFSWVGNFVSTIWNKVKKFFGISSPSSLFYSAGKNLMLGLFHGIRDNAHHAAAAARSAAGSVSGALGGDALANQALARRIFPWPASQWPPFVSLVMAESGFNRFAKNPTSGAYGIAQALPPTKYPFAGQAAGGSHAGPQLSWMFNYIAQRYSTPANAWAHELSAHWYGSGLAGGLFTSPTLIGVGERGPEMVNITPLGGRGGPGTVVNVTVQVGHGTHPVAAAQEIAKVLNQGAALGGVRLRKSILGPV